MAVSPRHFEIAQVSERVVVTLTDAKIVDKETVQAVGAELCELADRFTSRTILLNLGRVEYLSSTALGKFITLHRRIDAAGGQLILCNLNPSIDEVLEITKLGKLFRIQRPGDEHDPDTGPGGAPTS